MWVGERKGKKHKWQTKGQSFLNEATEELKETQEVNIGLRIVHPHVLVAPKCPRKRLWSYAWPVLGLHANTTAAGLKRQLAG